MSASSIHGDLHGVYDIADDDFNGDDDKDKDQILWLSQFTVSSLDSIRIKNQGACCLDQVYDDLHDADDDNDENDNDNDENDNDRI